MRKFFLTRLKDRNILKHKSLLTFEEPARTITLLLGLLEEQVDGVEVPEDVPIKVLRLDKS